MPEKIVDGKGTGYLAGVTDENRLMISGPTTSKEHHTNFTFQDAYNAQFSVTPTSTNDVFLYIKNLGALPIVCEGFNIRCASNEVIRVTIGATGTPVGGAAMVPANLYAGSGNKAVGVFQTGNDITGLVGGTIIAEYYVAGSSDSKFRNFDADVVIPQNQTIIFAALIGAIDTAGFLVMWHDHGEGGTV